MITLRWIRPISAPAQSARQRDAYWKRPGADSAALSTLLASLRSNLELPARVSSHLPLTHVRRPRQRSQLSAVRLSDVYIL